MNRYEFEDRISDYLDNHLNVSERQAFEKYAKENNHPLQITKKILGIAVLETVNDLLGEMDDGDNNSNYFVN